MVHRKIIATFAIICEIRRAFGAPQTCSNLPLQRNINTSWHALQEMKRGMLPWQLKTMGTMKWKQWEQLNENNTNNEMKTMGTMKWK